MTILDDGLSIGPTGGASTSPAHVDLCADLPTRLAALSTMERDGLAAEWRRQFRAAPPDRVRRDLLELGIAWKLQEKAIGGLKKAITAELRDLAEALATTGDIRRAKAPRLKPGARLVREWGGVTHEVTVTDGGFLWKGRTWTSLSAIAGRITGAHWSGPRFFGLAAGGKATGHNKAKPRMTGEQDTGDA
ncbi:DUF2924 domain-containing protein [Xanthobacter sp. AM11]|uniref:DUF2924 domain-containing protein n=1 Tax=Xanthobacter sp. AM11 TaxID=3380643 RepID=UPI0039BEEE59